MVWVKTSDDFMLDERVQAVDCCADSALRAAYEVCNRTETDGVFYLDQLMTRWSPAKGNPPPSTKGDRRPDRRRPSAQTRTR